MTFDQVLAQLGKTSNVAAKNRLVREFAKANASPIIENSRATFFYLSDNADTVALAGDWTSWKPSASMICLPDTPLWYRIERFPRAARLEYRIVVNDTRRLLDPHNAETSQGGFGFNSVLTMPDYAAPAELAESYRGARGRLESHWLNSREMQARFTFYVYMPPRFDSNQKYPTTYWNDGTDYLRFGNLARILDYLIGNRRVPPCIAVFVKPNDRRIEYTLNNQYVRFLANELVPRVDEMFPTLNVPNARAIIGASLGGLAAAFIARRRSNLFGLVGAQSGAFGFQNDAIIRDYAECENLGTRLHLIVGDFETDLHGSGKLDSNLVAAQQRFVQLLQEKNYAVSAAAFPEGHQWGFWRAHVGDLLKFFWG